MNTRAKINKNRRKASTGKETIKVNKGTDTNCKITTTEEKLNVKTRLPEKTPVLGYTQITNEPYEVIFELYLHKVTSQTVIKKFKVNLE